MLFCNRKVNYDHFCYGYCSTCMFQSASFVFINTKSCSKIWLCLRNQKEPVDKAETKVAEQDIKESAKVTFPVIYFTFNSIDIQQNEETKLNAILKTLKENPNMKVTVTGWCDTKGSVAVNKRISRQRAEAVKTWLVKNGIEASRITAIGNGSDDTQDADKARRVETTDNHQ